MKKFLATLVLGAMLTSACTTTNMLTIRDAPINANAQSGDIGALIESAMRQRGWQVADRRPGAIDAFLAVRQHRADITISYDADSYSITYRDSAGLDYRNGKIHRNYNRWINNLNTDIQVAMSQAR